MSVKHYLSSVAGVVVLSLAMTAEASLTIVNNTTSDSTTRIHNILNKCSSDLLGEAGITRAGKTNVVSDGNLRTACFFSQNNCEADVYASANCTGDIIATMTLSLSQGIKKIEMKSPKYSISANGFHVVFNEVA